jgi:hypothetical protein
VSRKRPVPSILPEMRGTGTIRFGLCGGTDIPHEVSVETFVPGVGEA